jgi:hypothetical protein
LGGREALEVMRCKAPDAIPKRLRRMHCGGATDRLKVRRRCQGDPVFAPVAQLDRALPSEGRGQRFESSRVRQYNQ